jgi:hypothetical protein
MVFTIVPTILMISVIVVSPASRFSGRQQRN